MREIMRGSQLDALLQAWTNFSMIYIDMNWDYMIAKLFYEVSCFPGSRAEKTGCGSKKRVTGKKNGSRVKKMDH